MARASRVAAFGLLAAVLCAATARRALAGDGQDPKREIAELKARLSALERRVREAEGSAVTQDEIATAVERYLGSTGSSFLVGGAESGKAGWPKGKRPFIEEGPNKLEIGFRSQIRYEAFLYSDDARASTANDDRPKDRSGFEVETLLIDLQGTAFSADLSYRLMLNFDSDSGSGIEKRWAYVDWRYTGDHHIRAGQQKVVHGFEEYASAATLMFVDRNLATRAFGCNYDTGLNLWGTFGDACEAKRFRYGVQALNGEGRNDISGSVFADATDKFSDQLLFAAMFEWNITGKEWAWDEVDQRPCEDRGRLDASVGVSGYYENDDDTHLPSGIPGSLAVKGNGGVGPLTRWGANAWFRARWHGFSFQAEYFHRDIDYTAGSPDPDPTDTGAYAQAHYRVANSPWGLGAKYAIVWADDDYFTAPLEDTFWEAGAVVNYFVEDHAHKVSLDVTRVVGNSGVNSSSPGYLVNAARGVVVEDGWLLRLQWQINF